MTRLRCLAAVLVLMLIACQSDGPSSVDQAATQETCKIDRIADLPVRFAQGHILIPAAINDTPVQLIVDTGASASMLTPGAVALLDLPTDLYHTTTVHGTGGTVVTHNTSIRSFRVGDQDWLGSSIATGRLPGRIEGDPPVVGLLGADRLTEFDVELDVPSHRMTLWRVQHCYGDFVPWQGAHDTLQLARYRPNRMVTHIAIDGHPVTALIDWGSRSTTVTDETAVSLGVTSAMMARDPSGNTLGVDQNEVPIRMHRFDEVLIGSTRFHNVALEVAALRVTDVGMLLGADYVTRRHVWLSYASDQLFVQRGPQVAASR
jgi:predicted aspartyl protease